MTIQNTTDSYYLGQLSFAEASELQRNLACGLTCGNSPNTFLFLHHPPVITLGKNAIRSHILATTDELHSKGIATECTDRGGGVTYHGLGQLVVYPILRIRGVFSVRKYVKSLQTVVVQTLDSFGIDAVTKEGSPGVWVGDKKISSLGIRIHNGVSTHGLSLNVFGDLAPFRHITACNDPNLLHTSMDTESGTPIRWETAIAAVAKQVEDVFETKLSWQDFANHEDLKVPL